MVGAAGTWQSRCVNEQTCLDRCRSIHAQGPDTGGDAAAQTANRLGEWMAKLACPDCGSGSIAPIMYGMPAGPPTEDDDFIVGGCMVGSSTHGCHDCGWTGSKSDAIDRQATKVE